MTAHSEIENLYRTYLEQAIRAEENRKIGEGLFGIGKKPADDPCHTQFIDSLQTALDTYADSSPASADIKEVLSLVFRFPTEHCEPASAYWMLLAAHGTVFKLIPLLSPSDAAELASEYGKLYRRWERLPVQKDVIKALQKASRA